MQKEIFITLRRNLANVNDAKSYFSFVRSILKAVICMIGGILNSVSLLEGIRDLTNSIKPLFCRHVQPIWSMVTL